MLGFSTWAFGGVAAGTGPFLVLLYTWAALHFSRALVCALVVPATLAYLVPLIVTGQPPAVLGSGFILLPVALGIALLVQAQAQHLRAERERLARLEQWRGSLISTLAHDVRSPLATVQMTLEELKNTSAAEVRPMLDAAIRQTGRIARLATGLLDLSRIEATGTLRLNRQWLPAGDLVREALSYVRPDGVTVDIDAGLTIWVDPERFEQIVVNLVANALRYGQPPVTVRAAADGPVVRIEVRDHGPGVPEELRPRLFTRFGVGGPDGTGLGLWIVRQLAEAHGGAAHYEPAGPGARFVITVTAGPR
ncbi:sensor histidine kinase [Jidongwangia harbinensis]|uniref:sensor histidine kinase n=1 Tax=Jidongwangia harbinensis TaxID=2878561 RepID=UPI001CD9D647|nr:HAMP domain-containing sensor histidine kinase [Jidongwangia harbinensis]MCA2211781.1 HAMP domain-containing histidine kinase [Jidongwangia harbinensis]